MRMSSMLAAVVICTSTAIATTSDTRAANNQAARHDTQVVAEADQTSANRKKRPAATGTQIACTRFGCNPIPRGCRIEKEYGWDGLPTGHDAVICPVR